MAKELTDTLVNWVNDLIDYESFCSVQDEDSIHALEVYRVELNSQWDHVKRAYLDCRDMVPDDTGKLIDKGKVRTLYREALGCYKRVLSSLNEKILIISEQDSQEKRERVSQTLPTTKEADFTPALKLPPCDIDTFHGGYQNWPSFRDLFSTLYIDNQKLSKVEKLFHLKHKTAGDAREIISHVPLTHDGFDIAWKSLLDRYENKRMHVNDQLKCMFNLPNVSQDSGVSILKLQRTIKSCVQTLTSLQIDTRGWDPILIYLCSTKLPRTFLEEFENGLDDCTSMPTWEKFDEFLTHKFKTLESVGNIKPAIKTYPARTDPNKKEKRVNTFQSNIIEKEPATGTKNKDYTIQNKNNQICSLCKDNHFIRVCSKFLAKKVNDRIRAIKMAHLCFNCLSKDHGVKDCKSKFNCRNCNQRHNTLLHKDFETHPATPGPTADVTQPSTSAAALNTFIQSTINIEPSTTTTLNIRDCKSPSPPLNTTLLFTAIVQIKHHGQRYDARAIIDPGSQCTFISDKLKNRLKLPTKRNLVQVTGLSQTICETSTQICLFNICSRADHSFELEVWAPVLKNLPSSLPSRTLTKPHLTDAAKLELADPQFFTSRPVDILIGMDIGPLIYKAESPMKQIGSLLAQNTVFGWIIGGPITQSNGNENQISLYNTTSLEKVLTRFWEVEDTSKKVLKSKEDIFCERIFKTTTKRNREGRYIVTLPFKPCEEIGASRNIALAQFYRMERKLSKTPDIKSQYDNSIKEYLELGHMRKISPRDVEKTPHYYLPHLAVIKPDRVTTKLRVVFNASSPTTNKRSLNDILYPGPKLQQDLALQIHKWRFFKYVFNADVTKMYRQILVDPTQTQYQRILYRMSPEDQIEDFELLTVTFGINCAPFLALRVLLQLMEDVKEKYPLAAEIILQNLYVDDVLAGGHTLEETIQKRQELTTAMTSAGFDLMKWTSNDPRVLQNLPSESILPINWLDIAEGVTTKTLGIRWSISLDSFAVNSPSIECKPLYTKREVLSIIAKFFDPCGWLAPIIVAAKLIMQQIWLDKIDWDEQLKCITSGAWHNFVESCSEIDSILVPRWNQYHPKSQVEIHGFCDASERAYAATLYVRVQNTDNTIHTYLLAAKTRVAPIRKISLPRLELCGAVLLAHLAASVIPNLQISISSSYYWTDSTIVLAWLSKPPCTWNTFVGNRISDILENVGKENWGHVVSEDNPADVASRGCTPDDLKSHTLWWHGPLWLKLQKDRWPSENTVRNTNLEEKSVKAFAAVTQEDFLCRFSSLSRAYRVLAYALRLWRNTGSTRTQFRISSMEISAEEIHDVKRRLIISAQMMYFNKDYQSLHQKTQLSPSSSLLTLNPFLDSKGIIRANGRLVQSPVLTYNERHPILLPYNARLSQLLVEFTHKITLHGGHQLMVRVLRSEYWIFRVKTLVKKVVHHCKTCLLYKQHTQGQIMSSLPPERTMISRPFTNTGVDFAGPFSIKNYTGRACLITKGYVCIFVCFSTKAIHLEATSDLSTQSFLAAFSRFIGRRGCPARLYSDNGTNFVGASEMLRKDRLEFIKHLQTNTLQQNTYQDLQWKFIPPGAPHMGGLWEAGVKSFKTHLRKVIPKMNFTYEELSTILARIESCLNSRPLSPSSDDPSDLSPLTPGHFLIGTPILAPAEPDISDENITFANRWKRLKIISQQFCQRWKSEYLKELHRRYKWKYQKENVEVNDLVVIKDEKSTPNEWKMGRIIKVYQGLDQNVRVVDLRTSNGNISRPITKIVKLYSD